jgi:hypothetical protein
MFCWISSYVYQLLISLAVNGKCSTKCHILVETYRFDVRIFGKKSYCGRNLSHWHAKIFDNILSYFSNNLIALTREISDKMVLYFSTNLITLTREIYDKMVLYFSNNLIALTREMNAITRNKGGTCIKPNLMPGYSQPIHPLIHQLFTLQQLTTLFLSIGQRQNHPSQYKPSQSQRPAGPGM